MLTSILYTVSTNALPMIIYLIVVIIISFVLYFSMEYINIDRKIIMFNTMFANLDRKKLLSVTGILVRTFMVIYSTFNYASNDILAFYIMIALSDLIFIGLNLRRVFFEVPNISAQIALIYVIGLIGNYRTQVNDDVTAKIIQFLIMSFVIIYSLVFLVNDFETIISKPERKNKREQKTNKEWKNKGISN